METFVYKKLNAFSVGQFNGNPAACIYLKRGQQLSEKEMLFIAKEHKGFVSEVIFCTPIEKHSYRLRYYSSECEVEFCGHGTIACMYDLIKNDEELNSLSEVPIYTNKGELMVYNELQSLDSVFITAPDPQFLSADISLKDAADNLKITQQSISTNSSIELIDAGLRTLIVPISDLNTVLEMNPDEQKLKAFCQANGVDIVLVFSTEVTTLSHKARVRVFAPKFGYLEDPATGSGNSAFGYYMLKHRLWEGEPIFIEQNGEVENYNIVKLKTMQGKVLFGGNAVIKINGSYHL